MPLNFLSATRPGLRRRAGAIGATISQYLPTVLRYLQQGVALGHELLGGGHLCDLDRTLQPARVLSNEAALGHHVRVRGRQVLGILVAGEYIAS